MEAITSAITGILGSVATLLTPSAGTGDTTVAVTYVAILAAPAAVGVMTLARKLARKAR